MPQVESIPNRKSEIERKRLAELPDVLSVAELMQALGISRQCAYENLRSGRIPSFRLDGRYLIRKSVIEALLEGRQATG